MTKAVGIDHSMDGLDRIRAEYRWLIPSRVIVVARYAFGSAIVVPARQAPVRPRDACCTLSSASPADPGIP